MENIYTANLVAIQNNKVLLVKRKKDQEEGDLWSLPGGTQQKDESIEDTLIREIKEELGIEPKNVSFFSKLEIKSENKIVLASYFTGEVSGDIKLNTNESEDFAWFDLSNIPQDLAYSQNKVLDKFLS